MRKYFQVSLQELGDERGRLVVAESGREIPFLIQRIFYMYQTKGEAVRGRHANRNSQFVFVCLRGSVTLKVDDGEHQEIILLDQPGTGLYMDAMVWKDIYDFSDNAILLVLSSHTYDEQEYIRDYEDFVAALSMEA